MSVPETTVRDRILQAAVFELADKGLSGSSLDRIAAAAGVTKPMVHYYFGSKLGLYEHTVALAAARVRQAVGGAPAHTTSSSARPPGDADAPTLDAAELGLRDALASFLAAAASVGDPSLRVLEDAAAEPASPHANRLESLLAETLGSWLTAARTRERLPADASALAAVLATALSPRRLAFAGEPARLAWRARLLELVAPGAPLSS